MNDLETHEGRLECGELAEKVFLFALEHNVFPNKNFEWTSVDYHIESGYYYHDAVFENLVSGDFCVKLNNNSEEIYIDVKAGLKISKKSIEESDDEIYYLMNMYPNNSLPFMFKKSEEFMQRVKNMDLVKMESGTYGYKIDFFDVKKYCGLCYIEEMLKITRLKSRTEIEVFELNAEKYERLV